MRWRLLALAFAALLLTAPSSPPWPNPTVSAGDLGIRGSTATETTYAALKELDTFTVPGTNAWSHYYFDSDPATGNDDSDTGQECDQQEPCELLATAATLCTQPYTWCHFTGRFDGEMHTAGNLDELTYTIPCPNDEPCYMIDGGTPDNKAIFDYVGVTSAGTFISFDPNAANSGWLLAQNIHTIGTSAINQDIITANDGAKLAVLNYRCEDLYSATANNCVTGHYGGGIDPYIMVVNIEADAEGTGQAQQINFNGNGFVFNFDFTDNSTGTGFGIMQIADGDQLWLSGKITDSGSEAVYGMLANNAGEAVGTLARVLFHDLGGSSDCIRFSHLAPSSTTSFTLKLYQVTCADIQDGIEVRHDTGDANFAGHTIYGRGVVMHGVTTHIRQEDNSEVWAEATCGSALFDIDIQSSTYDDNVSGTASWHIADAEGNTAANFATKPSSGTTTADHSCTNLFDDAGSYDGAGSDAWASRPGFDCDDGETCWGGYGESYTLAMPLPADGSGIPALFGGKSITSWRLNGPNGNMGAPAL